MTYPGVGKGELRPNPSAPSPFLTLETMQRKWTYDSLRWYLKHERNVHLRNNNNVYLWSAYYVLAYI